MDSIRIDFAPQTGTADEWNEAYARLSDYFRAHRLHSRVHRTYLILETLKRASETHARHPNVSPTEVAIHEARRMQRAWLRNIIGDLNIPEGRLDASGRMAFLLSGGPSTYPEYFLAADSPPQEMVDAMRQPIIQSGPDLAFSSMVPRPIDLGPISDIAEDAGGFFDRHPWLRYALLASLSALVLWGVYSVTR
ncbi:MAG: hypothetical protein DVB22_000640 [Verrucomicrobia bacterium]|jgi:hypothetical protein|nr:MAG: hypothetical protein DVB22_000640 [Verrucomicrobiota bacterium]